MGLFDFLNKNKHSDWSLLSRNNMTAFYKGFTTQQLHDAVLNIDVEKALTVLPHNAPEFGCTSMRYEKDEKTKKLCLYASFEQSDGYRSYTTENIPPEEAFRVLSAYIDLGMEPDVSLWKLEKFLKNMEPVSFVRFVSMFTGDKDILSRIEECCTSPLNYLKGHKEILPPDDFYETETEYNNILSEGPTKKNTEYILLNTFAYEMYNAGIFARAPIGADIDEFSDAISPLINKNNLTFSKDELNPAANDDEWCAALEEKWHYDGYVIIELDTRSFTEYYYICSYEEREEILLMAKRAGVDIIIFE